MLHERKRKSESNFTNFTNFTQYVVRIKQYFINNFVCGVLGARAATVNLIMNIAIGCALCMNVNFNICVRDRCEKRESRIEFAAVFAPQSVAA